MVANVINHLRRQLASPLSAVLITCASAMTFVAPVAMAKETVLRIQTYPGTVGAGMPLLWVAIEKGFCTAHNIKCQPVDLANGAIGLQALAGGSIDIAMASTDVAMQAASRGADVQLIGGAHPNGIFSLLARSDIALPNKDKGYPAVMHDLKGLKVSTAARGSSTEIWVRALLAGAGMDPSDVTFVAVGGPSTAYQALLAKQVDIVMSWEPFQTICKAQNTCKTVLELRDPSVGPAEIRALSGSFEQYSALRPFVKANPEAIDAFNAALKDAVRWVKAPENFEELMRIIKQRVSLGDVPNGDQLLRELVAREVKTMDIYLDRSAIKANAGFLLKYGLMSTPFDTTDFVYKGVPSGPTETK